MNTFTTWQSAITASLNGLWVKFINFIPQVIAALIVLIVGLLIASALGELARRIVGFLRIDQFLESSGVRKRLNAAGVTFTLADLIGWIIKWFLIIAVWAAVLQVLNLDQVGALLQRLVLFLPNVLTAVVILAIGLVGGQFMDQVVRQAVMASQLPANSAGFLAAITRWAIFIFALMAALTQLGVATRLIEILFTGLVAMLAIAGGLAFGLGGRAKAEQWLNTLEGQTKAAPRRR